MFEFEENLGMNAKIKVIGVGGGGGNAIKTMMKEQIEGVDFTAINTDVQSLKENDAMVKIQIGSKLTRGLGSGANPQVGREAAIEDAGIIKESLTGCDMVFITAGMGGGTGTGAASVIAKIARDLGILTVGVVTKPFAFEGRKRMRQAEQGIHLLKEESDTLIVVPNDNLLNLVAKDTPIIDSFKMVDYVLLQAVRGISDLITTPGLINLDFADICTIMKSSGLALMGTGIASGESRALEAAKLAIKSPLLENMAITGATGILLNITGSSSMTLFEVNEASKLIQQECHEDANIIFGTVIDESMKDAVRMTVIATGFGSELDRMKHTALKDTKGQQQTGFKGWTNPTREEEERPAPTPARRETPATLQNFVARPAAGQNTIRDIFEDLQTETPVSSRTQPSIFTDEPEELHLDAPLFERQLERQAAQKNRIQPNQKPFFSEDEPGSVQKTPQKTGPKKNFDENSFFTKKPSSAWGVPNESEESSSGEFGSVEPRVSRRRTEGAQEKSDFKKIISDIGLNDADADEYDIPAFIRRRAD